MNRSVASMGAWPSQPPRTTMASFDGAVRMRDAVSVLTGGGRATRSAGPSRAARAPRDPGRQPWRPGRGALDRLDHVRAGHGARPGPSTPADRWVTDVATQERGAPDRVLGAR